MARWAESQTLGTLWPSTPRFCLCVGFAVAICCCRCCCQTRRSFRSFRPPPFFLSFLLANSPSLVWSSVVPSRTTSSVPSFRPSFLPSFLSFIISLTTSQQSVSHEAIQTADEPTSGSIIPFCHDNSRSRVGTAGGRRRGLRQLRAEVFASRQSVLLLS